MNPVDTCEVVLRNKVNIPRCEVVLRNELNIPRCGVVLRNQLNIPDFMLCSDDVGLC